MKSRVLTANFLQKDFALTKSQSRLGALDIQRGFIMILMALSHCQEYIAHDPFKNSDPGVSPLWLGHNWFETLSQVAITSTVIGGFLMMMGIGVYFLWEGRLRDGWPPSKIARFLCLRGLLFIVLQMTVLQYFEYLASSRFYLYAGVLTTVGICMIVTALCLWLIETLERKTWLAIGIPLSIIIAAMVVTHYWMNHIDIQHLPLTEVLFLTGGHYLTSSHLELNINYTPIPWFSAVMFGVLIGYLISQKKEQGFKIIQGLILIMLIVWFVLRSAYLHGWTSFGDFKPPVVGETLNWVSYFCLSKYPPGMCYFLWSFSINLGCILIWRRLELAKINWSFFLKPLKNFGQSPLLFFVCHWYVYYGLSLFLPTKLTSISGILSGWLLGLLILYPMCVAFRKFKMQKPVDSFWRML